MKILSFTLLLGFASSAFAADPPCTALGNWSLFSRTLASYQSSSLEQPSVISKPKVNRTMVRAPIGTKDAKR